MSKRAKKPLSPNAARRAKDRDAAKTRRDLERLDALSPGGSPDRPIDLASASQVEPDAEGRPCPICGGGVRVESHDAATDARGGRLRVATVLCKVCRTRRARYYRLLPNALN